MGKRTFMLSGPGRFACLAFFVISLAVASAVAEPAPDEVKKPEPLPANQPAAENQTNAILPAVDDLPRNTDAFGLSTFGPSPESAAVMTEEVHLSGFQPRVDLQEAAPVS